MYADLETTYGNLCPSWALSVGYCGVASAAVLSNWGSAVSYVYVIDTINRYAVYDLCVLQHMSTSIWGADRVGE